MAGADTEVVVGTTAAPSAVDEAGKDAFDLELPDGMNSGDFERIITAPEEAKDKPEAGKDETVPAKTTAPVATKPAETTPAKGSTGKALAAERGKNKDLRAENQRLRGRWKEIEDERANATAKAVQHGALPAHKVTIDKPKPDTIVADAQKQEAKGESATEVVTKGLLDAVHDMHQKSMQKLADTLDERKVQSQERELAEDLMEDTGENLTEILTKGGIYAAITRDQAGNYADPVIARRVYAAANPAKAALRLARAKIAAEGPEVPAEVETEVIVTAPKVDATKTAVTADALAAAKRDGAREVTAVIAETAAKPRGVRVFTSAGGGPKVGRTPEFWDSLNRMMDKDGDKFLAIMDKNQELSTWFDRGRPKT